MAAAVLRSRAGLSSRSRGSSFLFLGPTGVGKTELAKALAELLFDDEKLMIRLDMSEYMEVRTTPHHTCPLYICPFAREDLKPRYLQRCCKAGLLLDNAKLTVRSLSGSPLAANRAKADAMAPLGSSRGLRLPS